MTCTPITGHYGDIKPNKGLGVPAIGKTGQTMTKRELKPNEYRCAVCREVYEKGWSDDEAKAELDSTFAVPTECCDLVCDDCYRKMGLTGRPKYAE